MSTIKTLQTGLKELENQLAQLENENADLRKQITAILAEEQVQALPIYQILRLTYGQSAAKSKTPTRTTPTITDSYADLLHLPPRMRTKVKHKSSVQRDDSLSHLPSVLLDDESKPEDTDSKSQVPEQSSARTAGVPEQSSARTAGVPEQSSARTAGVPELPPAMMSSRQSGIPEESSALKNISSGTLYQIVLAENTYLLSTNGYLYDSNGHYQGQLGDWVSGLPVLPTDADLETYQAVGPYYLRLNSSMRS
jgi:hypothetical protein